MHDGDRLLRQLDTRIELLDRRVIPGLDLAHENLGEGRTVDGQVTALDAFEIDHRHDAAHHRRELDEADLVEFVAGCSGMSEAPKVTVLALICLMPPPEPMD